MALDKQVIPLSFTGGEENRTDDFLSTSLNSLRNGEFVNKTTIGARYGLTDMITGSVYGGGGVVPAGTGKRMTRAGRVAAVESGSGVHLADYVDNKWQQIAENFNRCSAEARQIHYGGDHVLEYDLAGDSQTQVIVYLRAQIGTAGGLNQVSTAIFLKVIHNGKVLQDRNIGSGAGGVTGSRCPRVLKVGTKYFIFGIEEHSGGAVGTIVQAILSATDLGNTNVGFSAWVTTGAVTHADVSLHGGADYNFDICLQQWNAGAVIGTPSLIVAYMTSAQKLAVWNISGADGVTEIKSTLSAVTAHDWTYLRCVAQKVVGATGKSGYVVLAHDATSGDHIIPYIADLDPLGVQTIAAGTSIGDSIGRVAVYPNDDGVLGFQAIWDSDGVTPATVVGTDTNIIKGLTVTFSDFAGTRALGALSTLQRGAGIAGDPFVVDFGSWKTMYLPMIVHSETQSHYVVIEVGRRLDSAGKIQVGQSPSPQRFPLGDICARIDMNGTYMYNADHVAGSITIKSRWRMPFVPPHPLTVTAGTKFQILVNRGNGSRLLENKIDVTPLGLDLVTLDFAARLNSVEIGNRAVLAGACPALLDALQSQSDPLANSVLTMPALTELGFDSYPEYLTLTQAAGGALADGTYGVSALYEWYDSEGYLYRSAASPLKSIVIAAGGGVASITITVPTLRVTQKLNVAIAIYITEVNGTILYRALTKNANVVFVQALDNVRSVDTVTGKFFDATNLNGSDILYTTGNVLANLAYPACKNLSWHQDRLFFGGMLESDMIQYTKEKLDDDGLFPGTHPVFALGVDPSQGRVSATVSMDDKLMVLQERAIGCYSGRGPNVLGLDNQFSDYAIVLKGSGHSWDESTTAIRDQDGFWFRDNLGLRHMNRGLQLDMVQDDDRILPLGSALDDELVSAVSLTGATYFAERKQAVFAFTNPGANGGLFVYDTDHKQWSVWSSDLAVVACADPISLDGTLAILSTDPNVTDSSKALWFPSSQIQDSFGQQGTTQVILSVTLNWIKMAGIQGFQRASRFLLLIKPSVAGDQSISITEYVDYQRSPNVDNASITIAASNVFNGYSVQHQIKQQKCEAISFFISLFSTTGRARLSGMSLQVGVKKGAFKTPAANRF